MPVPWYDRDPKKSKQTANLVITLFAASIAILFFPIVLIYLLLKDGKYFFQKLLIIFGALLVLGALSGEIELGGRIGAFLVGIVLMIAGTAWLQKEKTSN